MTEIAKISLLVYAALVAGGGIMGFVKAQSKASLIAGGLSAIVLVACYVVALGDAKLGLMAGAGASVLLIGVFAMRFAKTKKFMPSGLMIVLSVIEAALIAVAITSGTPNQT